jgi:hypothetical protein
MCRIQVGHAVFLAPGGAARVFLKPVIKTTPARYEALEMRLRALHPLETPEIIAIPVVINPASVHPL